jgi:hypothetical protein
MCSCTSVEALAGELLARREIGYRKAREIIGKAFKDWKVAKMEVVR